MVFLAKFDEKIEKKSYHFPFLGAGREPLPQRLSSVHLPQSVVFLPKFDEKIEKTVTIFSVLDSDTERLTKRLVSVYLS